MPSVDPRLYPLAMTLPYFETHFAALLLLPPVRDMPEGKAQRSVLISSTQSIDLPITTFPSEVVYMNRLQDSADDPMYKTKDATINIKDLKDKNTLTINPPLHEIKKLHSINL